MNFENLVRNFGKCKLNEPATKEYNIKDIQEHKDNVKM